MKATLLPWALVAIFFALEGKAFVVQPAARRVVVKSLASTSSLNNNDEQEREYARVRRRGARRQREQEDEAIVDDATDRSRSRSRPNEVYDNDEWIDYDRLDDLLDDDDDYIYDEEEYDLMSNVLIPNPLLDSMDPDGAAERFPELAADPKFWFDMVLFVAFLNFLSFCGPQDPFPDIPWY